MSSVILNIAAGKFRPLKNKPNSFLINLDTMYYKTTPESEIEQAYESWSKSKDISFSSNEDAFTFMERTKINFSDICLYRFLEHVDKDRVLYFIYLLSTCMDIGGMVDVIVPNYKILAQRILDEDVCDFNFPADDITTTFELLNEPNCPHASIWTADRASHFFSLEGRFEVSNIEENFEFDGRNLYLRFQAKRIK